MYFCSKYMVDLVFFQGIFVGKIKVLMGIKPAKLLTHAKQSYKINIV